MTIGSNIALVKSGMTRSCNLRIPSSNLGRYFEYQWTVTPVFKARFNLLFCCSVGMLHMDSMPCVSFLKRERVNRVPERRADGGSIPSQRCI